MTSAENEVMDLERRRCNALSANDTKSLSALFAEEYVHCHSTGKVQNKAEMIEHMVANPRIVEPRAPRIRVYGDTAILTGEMVNRAERGGSATRSRLFVTQVAHRDQGGWKFVSFQSTRLPD